MTSRPFVRDSKYTHEVLQSLAADSTSTSEVIRRLGVPLSGSTHRYIRRRLTELEIDTSHFMQQPSKGRKKPERQRPADDILVRLPPGSHRVKAEILRRAMIAVGIKYVCECGLGPEWRGKPMTLEVDHLDGNNLNNERTNVRFLCRNCHSQTATYGRRSKLHVA